MFVCILCSVKVVRAIITNQRGPHIALGSLGRCYVYCYEAELPRIRRPPLALVCYLEMLLCLSLCRCVCVYVYVPPSFAKLPSVR